MSNITLMLNKMMFEGNNILPLNYQKQLVLPYIKNNFKTWSGYELYTIIFFIVLTNCFLKSIG
jgi:hypothetical protein